MASNESFSNRHPHLDFVGNIVSMFIIATLFIAGVYLSLVMYTHHGNNVVVPNVIGKDYKEAKAILEKAGLRVHVSDTGYVTKLAPDLILDQHIPAGTTVKFNRPIFVTINSDHARMIALPEVIDGSARQAEMKLKGMGFKVGPYKLVSGDRDLVMGVEVSGKKVAMGDRISVETPIILIVGNGDTQEVYNGNDSLDWALELEIQEAESAKEEQARMQRERNQAARVREVRPAEAPRKRPEHEVEVQVEELAPIEPVQEVHHVEAEKIDAPKGKIGEIKVE